MKKSRKCENIFCIYQKDDWCLRKQISLDMEGRCKESVCVVMEEEQI